MLELSIVLCGLKNDLRMRLQAVPRHALVPGVKATLFSSLASIPRQALSLSLLNYILYRWV